MKTTQITYYMLPLSCIPFKEIPSLESFQFDYAYSKVLSLKEFMGSEYYLVSIYDYWSVDKINNIEDFKNLNVLFGDVLSDKPKTRGEVKCIPISKEDRLINKEQLPHLRYCSSESDNLDANWFYLKDGNYFIFSAIKSTHQNVKHLEDMVLYGDNIIRLRIIIELLKQNIKRGIIKLSNEEFEAIAYKVLKSNPSFAKTEDSLIKDGVKNWLPQMLSMPLYEDIPVEIRGKAIV